MQTFDSARFKHPLLGVGLALLVLGATGTSLYTTSALSRERRRAEEMAASNQVLNSSLRQMRLEVASMSEKLNALATAPPPPPAPPAPARVILAPAAAHAATRRSAPRASQADERWNQVQTRLADHQKQIASTRQEVDQTRQDLTNNLNSTRNDLNSSIARNRDELTILAKRGERKYYEFHLGKSKEFQRVGPLSVSVRKVDFKHKCYDLRVMVDDRELEKKHINLYEPLLLTLADRPQPIELVVNGIDKTEVKGYVSEPKYKESELAAAGHPATDAQGLQRR